MVNGLYRTYSFRFRALSFVARAAQGSLAAGRRALFALWNHKLLTATGLSAVVLLGLAWFDRAHVVVEISSVPKSLDESGFKAAVIAESVRYSLLRIELSSTADMRNRWALGGRGGGAGGGARPAAFRGTNDKDAIDMEIPGAKIKLRQAVLLVRDLFGWNSAQVTSYVVVRESGGLSAVVRIQEPSSPPLEESIDSQNASELGLAIARIVLSVLKPAVLAEYLHYEQGDEKQALVELDKCERRGTPERKADCLIVRGDIDADASRVQLAEKRYRDALSWNPRSSEARVSLAALASSEGEDLTAVRWIEEALKLEPSSLPARHSLASIMLRTGNVIRARAEAERAVKLAPKSPSALALLAETLTLSGERHRAAELLNQAVAYDTNSPASLMAMARFRMQEGRHEEADKLWESATRRSTGAAQIYNEWGNAAWDFGDVATAAARYAEAISLRYRDYIFHNNLARSLRELGHYEEASDAAERALQLNPRSALVRVDQAALLTAQGRMTEAAAKWTEAEALAPKGTYSLTEKFWAVADGNPELALAALRRALELEPWNAATRILLGRHLTTLGRFAEARRAFQRASATAPMHPFLLTEFGRFLAVSRDIRAAEAKWSLALALDSNSFLAHARRGEFLLDVGNYGEASREFHKAIALNPRDPWWYVQLANAYANLGRHEEAERYFELSLRLNPGHLRARSDWARMLAAKGNFADAEAKWAETLKINPGAAFVHAAWGQAVLDARDVHGALRHFENALAITPRDPWLRTAMANANAAAGRFDKADEEFDQALVINPTHVGALADWGRTFPDSLQEAEARWRRALAIDRKNASTYAAWGQTLADRKDYTAALHHLRKAVALRPMDHWTRGALADVHSAVASGENNDQWRALEHAWVAVDLNPRDASLRIKLGRIYEAMQKPFEAREQFDESLRLDPTAVLAR